jgi:hypothetical protein
MADAQETRLAPPGAGLPLGELLLARTLFALRRWTSSRRSFRSGWIVSENWFAHCFSNAMRRRGHAEC